MGFSGKRTHCAVECIDDTKGLGGAVKIRGGGDKIRRNRFTEPQFHALPVTFHCLATARAPAAPRLMKVFTVSDLHVDFEVNALWVEGLSRTDHQEDVLVLPGDVSDCLSKLERTFDALKRRFKEVLYVPGNHELWVKRDPAHWTSLDKLREIRLCAARSGVLLHACQMDDLVLVPVWSWYDFSFGRPDAELERAWMDFRACRWPTGWRTEEVADYFFGLNAAPVDTKDRFVISFSHFMPRTDLMPAGLPDKVTRLFPVLGSSRLEAQIRLLESDIHIYGHSHLNRREWREDTLYVNNAFAYPRETRIAAKALICVHETP